VGKRRETAAVARSSVERSEQRIEESRDAELAEDVAVN
jgi:hypothetical protein